MRSEKAFRDAYAKRTATMAAKPRVAREPVMAAAAPGIGGEVGLGGVTEVPLDGVGKPEIVGTGVVGTGGTTTEVRVGTDGVVAGQELMVTVTVTGGAGPSLPPLGIGAPVLDGTGMMVVDTWPTGQLVTVGAQLVMVLTMVV